MSSQIFAASIVIMLSKKVLSIGIDPLNFTYQLFIISGLILSPFILIYETKKLKNISALSYLQLAFIGFLIAISYYIGFIGLRYSTATNYTFLIQTSLFFTLIFARIFLGEKLTLVKVSLGIILLTGCYFVATAGQLLTPHKGDFLIIISTMPFALHLVLAKNILTKIPVFTYSVFRNLLGGLFLLIYVIYTNQFDPSLISKWVMLASLAISFGLFAINKALQNASTAYVSMMSLLIPVITSVFAFLIYSQKMNTIQIIGGLIILSSGFLINKLKI